MKRNNKTNKNNKREMELFDIYEVEIKCTVRKYNLNDEVVITDDINFIDPDEVDNYPDEEFEEFEFVDKKKVKMVDEEFDGTYENFIDDLEDAIYDVKVATLAERWLNLFDWELTEEEEDMFLKECLEEGVCPRDVVDQIEVMLDLYDCE